jgi:hypothetical protein
MRRRELITLLGGLLATYASLRVEQLLIGEAERLLTRTDFIERIADGAVVTLDSAAEQDRVAVAGKNTISPCPSAPLRRRPALYRCSVPASTSRRERHRDKHRQAAGC